MAARSTSGFLLGGAAVNLGLWLLATTVGLPVLIVVASGLSQHRRTRLLATTGRHATGYVVQTGSDYVDMSGDTYWVKVQYDCDGELVTARVTVRQRDWERYRAVKRVGLTYVPSRPQLVDLD
jgi:hypothetical protein